MTNKISNVFKIFFLFIITAIIIASCSLSKKVLTDNVFKCYCVDGEINVYYRYPNLFKDKIFIDTLKNDYFKLYFPNNKNDTFEVFVNNTLISDFINNHIENDEHIYFDYSKLVQNPILTIRKKGSIDDCMQIVVDRRYRIIFVSKGDND